MNRKELKREAKKSFKSNYWRCILSSLILNFALGTTLTYVHNAITNHLDKSSQMTNNIRLFAILNALSVSIIIITFLIRRLVLSPLYVGAQNFFLVNSFKKAHLYELVAGFKRNYKNVVWTMFLHDLYIALWTCLLIIPGIIKCYSYRMVPFILAENPRMPSNQIIQQSKKMMNGHKLETFLLDLSFIGWEFLSIITLGIVRVLWTEPYYFQTNTKLYKSLKEY